MEKVFNLTARLQDRKRKEQVEAYRDRFEAVQRVLQCSACQFKCAMCNRHIENPSPSHATPPTPSEFILCDSCQSEFEAYQKMSQEQRTEAEVFWHNTKWMSLWACWLEYQRSLRDFRNSFDFNRISNQVEE